MQPCNTNTEEIDRIKVYMAMVLKIKARLRKAFGFVPWTDHDGNGYPI